MRDSLNQPTNQNQSTSEERITSQECGVTRASRGRAANVVIEHDGQVVAITADVVKVKVVLNSACGGCQAKYACGMSESKEKLFEVSSPQASDFVVGDSVTIGIHRSMGSRAVLLAYVGASVVLVGVLLIAIEILSLNEGIAALAAIASVGLYYFILWALRSRFERFIHFSIRKK